jgi:hypothetical protein
VRAPVCGAVDYERSVRERDAIGKVWLTKQKRTLGEQKQEFTLNFIEPDKFPERIFDSLQGSVIE